MNLIKKLIAFIMRLFKKVTPLRPYDPRLRIARNKKGTYVLIQLKIPDEVFRKNTCFIHTSLKTISDLKTTEKTGGEDNVTKTN